MFVLNGLHVDIAHVGNEVGHGFRRLLESAGANLPLGTFETVVEEVAESHRYQAGHMGPQLQFLLLSSLLRCALVRMSQRDLTPSPVMTVGQGQSPPSLVGRMAGESGVCCVLFMVVASTVSVGYRPEQQAVTGRRHQSAVSGPEAMVAAVMEFYTIQGNTTGAWRAPSGRSDPEKYVVPRMDTSGRVTID